MENEKLNDLQFRLVNPSLIVTAFRYSTLIYLIYSIFNFLEILINKDKINPLIVEIIKEFNLDKVLITFIIIIAGLGHLIQRKRIGKLIEEKANYQAIAEESEPNRTSSGLTINGETPED